MNRRAALVFVFLLTALLLASFWLWRHRPRPAAHGVYPAGQDLGPAGDPNRSVWPEGGAPRARDEALLLLHNAAYTVGFSPRRGAPLWSAVRLFWPPPTDLGLHQGRPGTFEADYRLPLPLAGNHPAMNPLGV